MSKLEVDATTKELSEVMSTRFPGKPMRSVDVPEFLSYLAETTQADVRVSRLLVEVHTKEGLIDGPTVEEVKGVVQDSQGEIKFELVRALEKSALRLAEGFAGLDLFPTRAYVTEEDQRADIARFRPYSEAVTQYFTK